MKTTMVMVVLFVAFSNLVFAGTERGNGGDVVFCPGPVTATAELLDIYEGRVLRNLTYTQFAQAGDYLARVNSVLSRLQTFDPVLANRYQKRLPEMLKSMQFIKGIVLKDVPDSNHDILPVDCELRQVAIRKEKPLLNEAQFIVSQDLFELLDEKNKAALILHELVYEHFTTENDTVTPPAKVQPDSIRARYFNSYLLSDVMGQWTFQNYVELQAPLDAFEAFYFDQTAFLWRHLRFDLQGRLKAAFASPYRKNFVNLNGQSVRVANNFEWHENGRLASIEAVYGPIKVGSRKFEDIFGMIVKFDNQGFVTSVDYGTGMLRFGIFYPHPFFEIPGETSSGKMYKSHYHFVHFDQHARITEMDFYLHPKGSASFPLPNGNTLDLNCVGPASCSYILGFDKFERVVRFKPK